MPALTSCRRFTALVPGLRVAQRPRSWGLQVSLCTALVVGCSVDEREPDLLAPTGAGTALRPTEVVGGPDAGSAAPATPGAPGVAVPGTPGASTDGVRPPSAAPTPPFQPLQPSPSPVVLELNAAGSGSFGRVRSTPPGLDCSVAPCRASFASGSTVTLEAWTEPSAGDGFAGWSGACTGLDACTLTLTGDLTVTARYEPANRVFVTSTLSDGNLGGLAGADALCTSLARPAGISGEVRAWLSTSSVDAIDRLQGSRGWVRMDGKPVVDAPENLLGGELYHPIRIDELGRDVGASAFAFTGTGTDGRYFVDLTCQDWTSSGGTAGAIGEPGWVALGFTSGGALFCSSADFSIYCFEVGKSVRVAPAPVAGRVAFLGNVALDGGLAAADAQCQAQAGPFSQVGTFKAVLASVGASAASRFNLAGAPWVRVDGVPIAPTAAAFFQAELWDASPNLNAQGTVSDEQVMAGASSLLEPGTSENTCANWTSASDTIPMVYGRSLASDALGYFHAYETSIACAQRVYGVLCLQE